jgi:hypothetical protein
VGLAPYLLLRVADDAAYCAGVWTGCLTRRSLEPVLPAPPPRPRRRRRKESAAGVGASGVIDAAAPAGPARLPSTM